jgi:glucose/arabinose dehydrogenase
MKPDDDFGRRPARQGSPLDSQQVQVMAAGPSRHLRIAVPTRAFARSAVATKAFAFACVALLAGRAGALTLAGPGLDESLFRVSVFADGLNYPVGMTALEDGSILAAVTNGGAYFGSSTGSIIRLADADGDGVAEQRQTLVADVAGGRLTALRRAGSLVAVTGQGNGVPISIYRLGAGPSDPLSLVGRIDLNYPSGGWLHPHSALAFRQAPGQADRYELYFQLGSDTNFAETTRTVTLSGSFGVSGSIAGDAVHRIELQDGVGGLSAVAVTQIATGLRNASGLAFHPATGDLYIGENGIDGLVNVNEPHSADEINVVPAASLGQSIVDFGFPNTYEAYRTGVTVGNTGVLPLATFQPIPPADGDEAEGVNEIAFSPPRFPAPLAGGIFAGFHGRFNLAGLANEENPLAFVNLDDLSRFYAVANSEPDVGHLDGLLATADTLYIADISSQGAFSGAAENSGKIYAVKSLLPAGDYDRSGVVDGADFLLWQRQLGVAGPQYAGADGDGSGLVDAADLAVWSVTFGSGAGGAQRPVPEPAAALLALFAAPATLASRIARRAARCQ